MKLTLDARDRDFLLAQLTTTVEGIGDAFRRVNQGREWDEYDPQNDHGIAILVRARDDLSGEGPWHLEAPQRDLELLIGRMRAGSSLALEIGGRPPPHPSIPTLHQAEPGSADAHLDTLALCDRLLAQLLEN